MACEIWNGKGEAEGFIYFTKDNGEIVGRPYVRRRAVAALSRFGGCVTREARAAALSRTVDNDDWLRRRALNTVSSICRDVQQAAI